MVLLSFGVVTVQHDMALCFFYKPDLTFCLKNCIIDKEFGNFQTGEYR